MDPLEIRHAKLIILWATNTKLTNRHLWPTIEEARADGTKVVVIDPIRTATAAAADWFLQPRPGTDIALMLAMMHVLIRDGLVDDAWVAAHTTGFDELAESVAEWTPERAATATGLDAADIETLAREYGTIRPAAIRTLIGGEHHENGAMFFRTLACLPALVGAWNDRGGGLAASVGSWQGLLFDEDALDRPDLLGERSPRWFNMSRLGEALTDSDPPIHALVVWNSNPLVIVPNAELTRRGLERDDLFTIVHEQFLTDTARYADFVLPATTQIESTDVVPAWGHLWMGWNEAAIEPLGEAVNNGELFRRIAQRDGADRAGALRRRRDDPPRRAPERRPRRAGRDGWLRVPYPEDGRPWADGDFPTASGKVELASDRLEEMGQPRVATYVPPARVLMATRPWRLGTRCS